MANEQLVTEGLVLMLVGMGTVFVFLTVLVLATTAMSHLLARDPDNVASVEAFAAKTDSVAPHPDRHLIAVITAAVHRHRKRDSRSDPPS